MSGTREFLVRVLGDSTSAQRSLSQLNDTADQTGAKFGVTAEKLGTSMRNVGIAATGAGGVLLALSEDAQKAEAQARTAVENTGAAWDEFGPKVDSLGKKMIKLGHDDEAAARAFATLATATQDPARAIDEMGLVADIAAARHISLESAADKVAKMHSGNTRIFKEFGITLGANATEGEKAAAMQELLGRVSGQAAAQADTFGNKLHVAKETMANFGEELGAKVGPALVVAGPLIGGLGQIIASGLVPKLLSGTASFAGFAASAIASGLSAAAAALPVLVAWAPVILTIGAIGVAAWLLWENWDKVFGFIKDVAGAVAGFITDNLGTIAAVVLLPVAPLLALARNWDEIWGGIRTVIGEVVGWIGERFSDVVGFVAELPGKLLGLVGDVVKAAAGIGKGLLDGIVEGISGAVGFAVDFAKTVVNALIDIINNLVIGGINSALEISWDPPGPIGKISLNPPDIPDIPRLHSGGVFRAPIPGGEGLALLRDREVVLTPGQAAAGAGGTTNNITVNSAPNAEPLHLAREIAWALS